VTGPLRGLRVLEMAGIGPAPFCAMMLADMGASITRIDRLVAGPLGGGATPVDRGRRAIGMDIRKPGAADIVLRLVEQSDALIEGFRPGVMERLGLGPDVCLARNPRLVYGRMTGWGQSGPLAQAAGHDINYIALSGALHAMGHADRPPPPPLHLVGDMGGGAMMLAFGMVCALLEARGSGRGQVVDAAICDGTAALTALYHSMRAEGRWNDERHANLLDGGAPFYDCYRCADGRYVAIGAIEPQFYALLLERCGLARDPVFSAQWDRSRWPAMREGFAALFAARGREAWCELLEGTDACFAPVLDFSEAPAHPHHRARGNFIDDGGRVHPSPAPRLSRTPASAGAVPQPGEHTAEILGSLGFSPVEQARLRDAGVIA
jgi:alpha-methylacyl-CoA racemase